MSTDDRKYVQDNLDEMIKHCTNVAYMRHKLDSIDDLKSDVMNQYAFTNALAQIGEHAKRIDSWLSSHSDFNWKGVIRFRDFVGHRYSDVDYDLVWEIINDYVPDTLDILINLRRRSESMSDLEFTNITKRDREQDPKPKRRFGKPFLNGRYRVFRLRIYPDSFKADFISS